MGLINTSSNADNKVRARDSSADISALEKRPGGRWVVAGLALFLAGFSVGHYVPSALWPWGSVGERAERPDMWWVPLVQNWGMTTSQTLVALERAPEILQADLARISPRLQMRLTPDKVALPGRTLKRAMLYHLQGVPLVELAYLDEAIGAVGFYIFADAPGVASKPELVQQGGLTVIRWADTRRSYLVVGSGPDEIMRPLAERLAIMVQS